MPSPSVTYTFSNSTTADATQVNQNFTDVINGITNGTKDLSISALTCAGAVALQANTTVGTSGSNTVTFNATVNSAFSPNANNTYDLGAVTSVGWRALYLASTSATHTCKLQGSATSSDLTFTLPLTTGTIAAPVAASATFTGSWSTNTTYTGFRWLAGDRAYYDVTISFGGAPDAGTLTITIPSGDTFNTAKMSSSATDGSFQMGWGTLLQHGTANFPLSVKYNGTTSVSVRYQTTSGANIVDASVTKLAPFTIAATDKIHVIFEGPIA